MSSKQHSSPVIAGAGLSEESQGSGKKGEMKKRQEGQARENSASGGRKTRSYVAPTDETNREQRRLCNLETTAQTANRDEHHIEATCSQFTLPAVAQAQEKPQANEHLQKLPDSDLKDATEGQKAILGKRANRGYNPKYDSSSTQFVCHDVAQKSEQNIQMTADETQIKEEVGEPIKKVPRKVGRPPKDKSLVNLKKQALEQTKKALKAQKHMEFRKLIARDLNFQNLSSTLNS